MKKNPTTFLDHAPRQSCARVARALSGTLWRPRDWRTETMAELSQDAAAFCRAVSIIDPRKLRYTPLAVIVSVCAPRQSDHRKSPTSDTGFALVPFHPLAEIARRAGHREDIQSRIDHALDLVAGYALLNGSSRPTMYGCKSVHGFGVTMPDFDDAPSLAEVQARFSIGVADIRIRAYASAGQQGLARAARQALAHQYAEEIRFGRRRLIDCALRAALISRILDNADDAAAAAVAFGSGESSDRLRAYFHGEAVTDDGTEAFALFAKEDAEGLGKATTPSGESLAEEVTRQRDHATREHDSRRNMESRRGSCTDDAKGEWRDDAESAQASEDEDLSQRAAMSLDLADERYTAGKATESNESNDYPALPIIIGE